MDEELYHQICYLCDYQDDMVAKLIKERDTTALAFYLSGWDYGERDDIPHTIAHLVHYCVSIHRFEGRGDYTLLINYGLGDAILLCKADEE